METTNQYKTKSNLFVIGNLVQAFLGLILILFGIYNSIRVLHQNQGNIGFAEIFMSVIVFGGLIILGRKLFLWSLSAKGKKAVIQIFNNRIFLLLLVMLYVTFVTIVFK